MSQSTDSPQPRFAAMIDNGLEVKLGRQIQTLQTLCFAFAGNLVVYVGLAGVLIEAAGRVPLREWLAQNPGIRQD